MIEWKRKWEKEQKVKNTTSELYLGTSYSTIRVSAIPMGKFLLISLFIHLFNFIFFFAFFIPFLFERSSLMF